MTRASPSRSGSTSDKETRTAVQTRTDTFAALRGCFATDLDALIGDRPPRGTAPNAFIDLAEDVRDVPGASSIGNRQDASKHLDSAADYLTDALTSKENDHRSLLAWARAHLRDAITTVGRTQS
ncbi:hypothetical protein [Streptomyces hebeiensis]